jgi:hypothetical protein
MKKKKGNVMSILSVLLGILGLSLMMITLLHTVKLLDQKEEISGLARQYILRMETVGCLAQNDRIALESRLRLLGMTEVDLSGTSFAPVGYGNPVYLCINGKLSMQQVNTERGMMAAFFEGQEFAVSEKRMSTAKY